MANAASEKGHAKARAREKEDATITRMVIEQVLSSKNGRRWIWLQLTAGNLFVETTNLDPQIMAWEKGSRNSALRLLQTVMRFPTLYALMTTENTGVELQQPPESETDNG